MHGLGGGRWPASKSDAPPPTRQLRNQRRPKRKEAASRRRDSMGIQRQNNQLRLAFSEEERSEAPMAPGEEPETLTAKRMNESPAKNHEPLMEEVCERENCLQALKRVKSNKGSPGIDGMTVDALTVYLKEHWPAIREQLRTYTSQPAGGERSEAEAGCDSFIRGGWSSRSMSGERGGSTGRTEGPRLQLYRRKRAKAAHRPGRRHSGGSQARRCGDLRAGLGVSVSSG